MSYYQTPEEMYRKRKLKKTATYAGLIVVAVGIILGLQVLLYNM
ncbi:hypothetical protein [Bacillus sp. D386]|nr:hypothetical protein [Bacillus sp. D386]